MSSLPTVSGSVLGRKVQIDRVGRIVPPKPVREGFHSRDGSELVIEERSDGLTPEDASGT